MKAHETYEHNPPNSRKNVLAEVTARFENKNDKVPELLSEFITLLGNEKEGWEGVRAMKVCIKEFFISKKDIPMKEKKHFTTEDFEEFLFSPNRNVIVTQRPDPSSTSEAVIPRAVDPPPETLKGPGRPSSSKAVIPVAVVPPTNPKTSKGPNNPSTSKKVSQGAVGETSVPPATPTTLKVKIYMGTGWDIDFEKLGRDSPPSLFVKLGIYGSQNQKTEVQKNTWTPCWGEEFVFPLSSLQGAKLIVQVFHEKIIFDNKFAGKFCQLVSVLKPGIQVILLSSRVGMPCDSARLLVRIMLD